MEFQAFSQSNPSYFKQLSLLQNAKKRFAVIPAQAGIQRFQDNAKKLDPRFHEDDDSCKRPIRNYQAQEEYR
jgi:hypothetical protein